MSERNGLLGGFFGRGAILWFIILFLLLFWDRGFFGREAAAEAVE